MKTSKKIAFLFALIIISGKSYAQMGVNATGAAPDPKAMLDISSTTKGLLIPRMTIAERNAISTSPGVTPDGLIVFDTDTKNLWIFKNAAWQAYLPSPWEASGNDIFNNNSGNVGIGGAPSATAKLKMYGVIDFSNVGSTRGMIFNPTSINDLYFIGGNAIITTSSANSNLILQRFADVKLAVGDIIPTQKVDIDGQIRIRGGSPAAGNVLTSSADGTGTWQVANDHNHIGQTWTHSALNGLTITNFASADFNVAIRGFANTALRSKGVFGNSPSSTGIGVYGTNTFGGGSLFSPADNSGVSGISGIGTGVFGASTSGRGLSGLSDISDGVYGTSFSGTAIFGEKNNLQTTGSAGLFVVQNAANTSPALVARSSGNIALEIENGYIKVSGTTKTAFVITAGTGSTIFTNRVRFSYPGMSSTDILIVNHQYVASYIGAVGNWYDTLANQWSIFREDNLAMPAGEKFTVLVIKQ